ncbi:glycosyltransferase family 4 protein [Acidobacteriota bacterium]
MTRVLLIHAGIIPHYRIPIYNSLSSYLNRYDYHLIVMSDGIQPDNPDKIEFQYEQKNLSVLKITRFIYKEHIDTIIDFMELKNRYLFPTYFLAKGILRRKMIYWGQGCDLLDANSKIKNLAYAFEQTMCSAIILYAEHLKKYVPKYLHKKIFIANNTLFLKHRNFPSEKTREIILKKYNIKTEKNIICMGRMQKRKKLDHLVEALTNLNRPDIGLILIGPDPEGILDKLEGDNIFKLGPIYGDKKYDLLSSADVFCLPGAVGLSIVDAFHCGLPFVTEEGDESAEIMYLKDGVNGFIVPKDNIHMMSQKLLLLLDNGELRGRFSEAAKYEIKVNGSMEMFCSGFKEALDYTKQ